jgi:hypothetical protein
MFLLVVNDNKNTFWTADRVFTNVDSPGTGDPLSHVFLLKIFIRNLDLRSLSSCGATLFAI